MALPTDSKNLVTVERLSAVIGGTDGTGGLWGKTKALVADKADKSATVSNVEWSSNKLTKTINGTTSDVVTASTIKTALSLTKSDVGLGNVDNTSDATKKTNFTGSIASGNTGFVTGGDAYTALNDKQNTITFDGTYSASTNKAATVSTVTNAIAALDVSAIAGAASKTLTSISETDGKISATYSDIAIAQSQVSGLATALNAKAPLASPALTGTPTAPTANAGTNTTQIATTAFVKAEINSVLDAADAMQFKGTIGSSGATVTALPDTHKAGWTYKVATAGTYAGKTCEVGDMIICVKDGTTAADADWTVVQNNIDGAVTGPASSVDARVAVFNGTTGKVIKDSGFTIGKSVPSDAVFTDTDTKVTSSANHYTPSTASGSDKSASASGATAAWGIDVVKGVTLNTDGKGHVTGISVTSGKIPANPNTDTKVKATAKTDNVNYKILATASASPTSGDAMEAVYDTDITLNPSTNTIAASISGNAATATSATTASNYATGGTIESALAGKAASNHTHDTTLATDSSSGTVVSLASNTQYKLTTGGTSVLFKTPSVPAAASNGALKIGLNGGTAASKFTANQSTDSTLTFAEGATNGTIAVDGTDVAVHGLGSAAYTASSAYATSGHTHSVTINGTTKTIPASGGTAVDLGTYLTAHQTIEQDGVTGATINRFGTCSTAAGTAAKTVTITSGTFALVAGARITVKFSNTNTATQPTLNVNNTGAKSIKLNNGYLSVNPSILKGSVTFIYDGSYYVVDMISTVSLTTLLAPFEPISLRIGKSHSLVVNGESIEFSLPSVTNYSSYGTCDTAESTTAKVVEDAWLDFLSEGFMPVVRFTNAVPASATLNFDQTGARPIYYRGAAITAGVIGAGDTATFIYDGAQYQLLCIDSGEAEMTSQEVTDLLAALT